jgi:hypothetical protein
VASFYSSIFATFYTIVEKQRAVLYVEQLLGLERFLVDVLRFVSVNPTIHAAIPDLIGTFTATKPRPDGFLYKFGGYNLASELSPSKLQLWLETLAFDDALSVPPKDQADAKAKTDIALCHSECQNAMVQVDLMTPKFDEDLEYYVVEHHTKIFEVQIVQELQRQMLLDSLRIQAACDTHGL